MIKLTPRYLLGIILHFLIIFPQVGMSQMSQLNPATALKYYEQRSWEEIDGVPIDHVFDIDQDEKGYIWLATNRGLLRFDSSKIEAYNFKNVPNLRTETVRFVEIGSDNTIWFGTRRGLYYIKDKIAYEKTNEDGSSIAKVLSLETSVEGVPYFTLDQTRKLYKIEDDKIIEVEEAGSRVFKVFPGANGKILGICYPEEGPGKILKINQKSEISFENIPDDLKFEIYSISEGPFGEFYCGATDNRLYKIEDNTYETLFEGPKTGRLNCVQVDNFGAVYFGRSSGLERYYKGDKDTLNEELGLTNNSIDKVFFDRDGNMWVGTLNGLNYFSKGPFTIYSPKDSNLEEVFNCVMQFEDGSVIVGSQSTGLYHLVGEELESTNIGDSLGKTVQGLAESKNANEFYLSTEEGVFLIAKEEEGYRLKKQILDENSGLVIEHSNGDIWVSMKIGRTLTDVDIEQIKVVRPGKEDIDIEISDRFFIREFFEDESGMLWLLSAQGLYKYDGNDSYTLEKVPELQSFWMTKYVVDNDNRMWMGTLGTGLHLFQGDSIKKFDTRNGLSVNQVQEIMYSKVGGFWMTISDEENRVERLLPYEDNGVQKIGVGEYYTFKHQFLSSNTTPSSIAANDGSFLIAGSTGLIRFNPKDNFYRQPRVRFDKIVVDNETFAKDKSLKFASDYQDFEFHYSAVDFIRGKSQIFEVKLEGLDEDWKSVGDRQVVYYSRLPAGKYTFNVRLLTPEFGKIVLESPVNIEKRAVWYKRKNVIVFMGLLLALFIYAAFQFRINQIKFQRTLLSKKVEERTAELNELNQNLEATVEERTKKISEINTILTKNEERYKYALEASTDGIWDWDVKNDEIQFSPAIYTMLGFEPYEFPETRTALYKHIHPEEVRKNHIDYHEKLKHEAGDEMLLDEYRMIGKNGKTVWIQVKGKVVERDSKGKPARMVGTHVNITKDKEKTKEILDAVLNTEFVERARISKDIHDGLQQTLTISSLNFQWVRKDISNLTEKAKEKFEQGWKYLQSSIDESRHVAHSLMPKEVLDFGVISAYNGLIEEFDKAMEGTRFNFYHNFEEEKIENQQVEIILYRILQEALNNITKYAKAKTVTIQLKDYKDMYMLTIEDDGVGFDVEKLIAQGKGLGFKSMQNRLDAINGFLEIESMPGRGTTILVEINK